MKENSDVAKVKKGYAELDWDERKAIRDFIKEFEDKKYEDKQVVREILRKSLGPISQDICPCCGR